MDPADIVLRGKLHSSADSQGAPSIKLRLYVARSTPSSVRAEHHLLFALDRLQDGSLATALEIVDVFVKPKRAITDGVVVTPTLIGSTPHKRIVLIGDLSDQVQLQRILQDLMTGPPAE